MAEGIKKISENLIIAKRALLVTDPTVTDNNAIEIGAIWTDPSNKAIKLKVGANSFSKLDASKTLLNASISTALLEDSCVTTIKIADSAVTEPKIGASAVTTVKVKDNAITEPKVASNAITESKIKNESVSNSKLASDSVTNIKILDNTIENAKLKDTTITAQKIASNTIINRVIADNAIQTRNYKDASITNSKLADGCIFGSKIKNNSITSLHLGNNSVTERSILNGAVTEHKIADKAIKNIHLSEGCVESINLSSNSVTTIKLSDKSVTTIKIADKSITKEKLGDDVIKLIGDPVTYDSNNDVALRKNLSIAGNVECNGTITANRVYNATFMDIAEGYIPEEDVVCIPGDIMQVNENGKLVRANSSSHFPIVGVVSDEYATCYGATEEELELGTKVAVGLIGKVHVNVVGPVRLGDKIAVAIDGTGASVRVNNLIEDNIIGKALESSEEMGLKKILCLIYPR